MLTLGVLMALGAPGFGLWMLPWLALIPLLLWVDRQTDLKTIFWGGLLWGFGYHGLFCLWFFDLHPLTWLGFDEISSRLVTLAGWLLIAVEGGLLGGGLMLGYRKLTQGWQRLVLFPILWVFAFSMLNWTPLALPWALLEYTQAPLWPMRWLAGIISGSGLTLLLVFHNVFWAQWLSTRGAWQPGKAMVSALPALLAPGLVGLLALWPFPVKPGPWPMPVAVIQANLPIEIIRSASLNREIIGPDYLDPPRKVDFPPGTLLVYPEEGVVSGWVPMETPLENPIMAQLQQLSDNKQLLIAVGVSAVDAKERRYNAIALLQPKRESLQEASVQFYRKRRLVPFGEYTPYGLNAPLTQLLNALKIDYSTPYQSGDTAPLLDVGATKVGGLVCFELIDSAPLFGGFARQYGHQGAQLLINTSNMGWFHQNPLLEAQFLAIGQIRAAETGLPLVMSSNTGISAILSSHGDILIQTRPDQAQAGVTQMIVYPQAASINSPK